MNRSWTVRDIRKKAAAAMKDRSANSTFWNFPIDVREFLIASKVSPQNGLHTREQFLRELDRIVSQYGANHVIPAYIDDDDYFIDVDDDNTPPRTDHKIGADAPISDGPHNNEDADTHGGNGNSGEVNHTAEQKGEDRDQQKMTPEYRSDDGGAAQDFTEGQQTTSPAQCYSTSDARIGEGECGLDKRTGAMGSPPDDQPIVTDDNAEGNSVPAKGDEQDNLSGENQSLAIEQGTLENEAAHLDTTQARVSGRDAGSPRPSIQDAAIRIAVSRIFRSLQRLTDVAGRVSTNPSPKWDAKTLLRELTSRRGALHRAHKTQPETNGVMVMPDLSGSCEWVSYMTYPIAEAVADRRHLVLAPTGDGEQEGQITHAIGSSPIVKTINNIIHKHGMLYTTAHWQAIHAAGIQYILVLGDVHGHASYEAARDAGVKVIWLDPNWNEMRVKDTEKMIYEAIKSDTPSGVAEAFEHAVRRTGCSR